MKPRRTSAARSAPYDAVISAPFGRIGIRTANGRLCDVQFLPAGYALKPAVDRFSRSVCDGIRKYLADSRYPLHMPLALAGSAHQRRVWRLLRRIRPGRVQSYGEIARRIGSSPRAVGAACRSNPAAIVVPCHRVVARDQIGGFMGRRAGAALSIKRWLLEHERRS